jgi:hypothetical protein
MWPIIKDIWWLYQAPNVIDKPRTKYHIRLRVDAKAALKHAKRKREAEENAIQIQPKGVNKHGSAW